MNRHLRAVLRLVLAEKRVVAQRGEGRCAFRGSGSAPDLRFPALVRRAPYVERKAGLDMINPLGFLAAVLFGGAVELKSNSN